MAQTRLERERPAQPVLYDVVASQGAAKQIARESIIDRGTVRSNQSRPMPMPQADSSTGFTADPRLMPLAKVDPSATVHALGIGEVTPLQSTSDAPNDVIALDRAEQRNPPSQLSGQNDAGARLATGASIAQQLADATRQSTLRGTLDVALHPEELGRVRISFTPAEAGLTVTVQADRAETLDLLRRHIEILGSDLRDRGFGDVTFEFGTDQRGGRDSNQGAGADATFHSPSAQPAPDGARDPAQVPALPASTGLDLRL